MSEQEGQVAKLKNFMITLRQTGCSPEFVIERGFAYAIRMQKEEIIESAILSGEDYNEIADTSTCWMDQAALWLAEVTRDLRVDLAARMERG